jgi:hypothetical protein
MLRPTVSRPDCLGAKPHLVPETTFLLLLVAGLLMWSALSDDRMGLSFTAAAGPSQRSHSRARVPRDSCPYFIVWQSRLSQPGGPGLRLYIPQDQGGQVIPPGTGFPLCRLLRLAGLRWRYSSPPPHWHALNFFTILHKNSFSTS